MAMIVATAGHVDHGKTSLVKALSGIDTDRLPDEKRRGLTIEPGFAYVRDAEGVTLGFVDVPGHERFIGNMLAGVSAIDTALLVVAADDGVMPQTREHVAILDLLGVNAGWVAITKVDRVEPPRIEEVRVELSELLAGTSLRDLEIHETSVFRHTGIDALRQKLFAAAARHEVAVRPGRFRFSIDRSFNLAGAGLIVTGAVISGAVEIGDQLLVSPAGYRARVRDIRVHDQAARRAVAGERAALNLVGDRLSREVAPRGAWVLDEALHLPTRSLDAQLRLLPDAPSPLKQWLPVHLHLGASHVTGHLALLGTDPISPGETGFVELVLDAPVLAVAGDRFIVRDQSARQTIGGGRIVNPFPPRRGRTRPQRRAAAQALSISDPILALRNLLQIDRQEVEIDRFMNGRNIVPEDVPGILAALALRSFEANGARLAVSEARWLAVENEIIETLDENHRRTPDHQGIRDSTLLQSIGSRPSLPLFRAVLSRLIADRKVARTGPWLHLSGHRAKLGLDELGLWRRMEEVIERDGLRAPSLSALSQDLQRNTQEVLRLVQRFETLGLLVSIAANRFLTIRQAAGLAKIAEALASPDENGVSSRLTAAAFREKSGVGRNQTIEVLEFFDRVGFTRRVGEHRRVLRSSGEVFSEPTVDFA